MTISTIYHRDSIECAYQVCKSGQLWSEDPHSHANFHTNKYGGRSQVKSEVTMIFEWRGERQGKCSNWPGQPNVLYHVPWEGNPDSLWSMVLFPGTNAGLRFVGISNIVLLDSDPEFRDKLHALKEIAELLREQPNVVVPHDHERVIFTCPPAPNRGLAARLLWALGMTNDR